MPLFSRRREELPRGRPTRPRSPRLADSGPYGYSSPSPKPLHRYSPARDDRQGHRHSRVPSPPSHIPTPSADSRSRPQPLWGSPHTRETEDRSQPKYDEIDGERRQNLRRNRDMREATGTQDRRGGRDIKNAGFASNGYVRDRRDISDRHEAPEPRRKAKSVPRQYERGHRDSDRHSDDSQARVGNHEVDYDRHRRPRSPTAARKSDNNEFRDDAYPRRSRSVDQDRHRRRNDRDEAGYRRRASQDRDRNRDRERDRDRNRTHRSDPRPQRETLRRSKSERTPKATRTTGSRAKAAAAGLPWQSIATAALQAGAAAAFKSRRDPGPWVGVKGTKVATAAISAAITDGMYSKGKRR